MVSKREVLPKKPKSLKVFEPSRFIPDWGKQGRRYRLKALEKLFKDVVEATYSKGVARVGIMAACGDNRKVVIFC